MSKEALSLMKRMSGDGLLPDKTAYNSAIIAVRGRGVGVVFFIFSLCILSRAFLSTFHVCIPASEVPCVTPQKNENMQRGYGTVSEYVHATPIDVGCVGVR